MSLVRVLEPEAMDTGRGRAGLRQHGPRRRQHGVCDALLSTTPITDTPSTSAQGPCLLPIQLCRRVPTARIKAIDLSAAMLDLGRRHVERAGLAAAIALALVDAKALPEADESFQPCSRTASSTTSRSRRGAARDGPRPPARRPPVRARPASVPEGGGVARGPGRHVRSERHRVPASSLRRVACAPRSRSTRCVRCCARSRFPECAQSTSDRHWTLAFRRAS